MSTDDIKCKSRSTTGQKTRSKGSKREILLKTAESTLSPPQALRNTVHPSIPDNPPKTSPQISTKTPLYFPHVFASIPSGGSVSTFFLLTSSQFVLRAVPLLSVKLFIMARCASGEAPL